MLYIPVPGTVSTGIFIFIYYAPGVKNIDELLPVNFI